VDTQLALALSAWKLASRHRGIESFATELLPLLQPAVPVERLLIRRLDTTRTALETVASAGPDSDDAGHRSVFDADTWQVLLAHCRRGAWWHEPDAALRTRLPGLVPDDLHGDLLALTLACDEVPLGAALLALGPGARVADCASLARTLAEPLAAALENDRHLRELSALREAAEAERRSLLKRLGRRDIADSIVGAQTGLQEVMERVELVARSDTPVLLLGETGTGKEVVARAIHRGSRRGGGPFLRVNCGALPQELIDSELFGHERGSFTGAVATHKGWFERADGGTLLLDEIGELTPAAQVRLLRVLQDGSVQRVGGQQSLTVDVRVVAATHRDLHAMVSAGAFREDLWYRVAVFPIRLPSLRERPQDIPAMATHFALRAAERLDLAVQIPSAEDLVLLAAYPWPGNVRELASVIERAAILGDGRRLEVAKALGIGELAPHPAPAAASPTAAVEAESENLDAAMRHHIEAALARHHGRVEGPFGVAASLGINPHTLRARMRKLGIDPRAFRGR
jgi:transcriptional regulator with GAF, ATPase, and Fis domain